MDQNAFSIVILNGRPAAGKSEILDYLKTVPLPERLRRFHIGEFCEIDDFPILWERFEDDDLMEEMGLPRLISDKEFAYQGQRYPGYVFKGKWFWNFLIRKINLNYARLLRDHPDFHRQKTVFLEFSRGREHGGFKTAYQHLSEQILAQAVTLYIRVDWPESLRKNRRRYNPDKPDSILQHALEDKKLEMLYQDSDWEEFSAADPRWLLVGDVRVPYAVFENMPEKTDQPEILGRHLEEVCGRLWNAKTGSMT